MHLHIIGICGTFMGGVARIAKELGHTVSGSDANTYPPMSTQLESLGVELFEGYSANNIPTTADIVVVGNTISRGNSELEAVLDQGLPYTSGAQWLSEHVLNSKWVLAVAGTHGKTTTASMLAWILEDCGYTPGFLIGGVPANFNESARLGQSDFFVIEADEYDTAFCDKRSKFIHYRPKTLVINNLEFDHADIFDTIEDIKKQFNHLLKTVPSLGLVVHNDSEEHVKAVLEMGCWSEQQSFGQNQECSWSCKPITTDCHEFDIAHGAQSSQVSWDLIGQHNMLNAVAAIAAAHHVGVQLKDAASALSQFKSVKRRLEVIYNEAGIVVYDDFAHHPTAIKGTLNGLRNKVGNEHIIAVLEPRSNTMKRGVHKDLLAQALNDANETYIFADENVQWDIKQLKSQTIKDYSKISSLLDDLIVQAKERSDANSPLHILIMSNGGFNGLHKKLVESLKSCKFT